MFRNTLVALLLVVAVSSWAQSPPRIAWLWPGTLEGTATIRAAFMTGMRENGMVEGTHFVLDELYADGKYDRFPALVAEMAKRNPAIIMVNTIAAVRAAQQATRTIPIVFVHVNDPVGSGLVASLARPGGNTTGLSTQNEDAVNKYVDLAREIFPRATRIAALVNPSNPSHARLFLSVSRPAEGFKIAARAFEVRSPDALDAAFDEIARYQPDVLLGIPEATFFDQRRRICALAIERRIPAIFPQTDYVTSGCLMSFATSRREMHRYSALFVKKILDGAKPADLPVEQPTKFELAVNLKTANALGITIPQSILVRADEVIQ
jgi:putative ABC transport system substrate-binding protein